jgi:hypothetical protein
MMDCNIKAGLREAVEFPEIFTVDNIMPVAARDMESCRACGKIAPHFRIVSIFIMDIGAP